VYDHCYVCERSLGRNEVIAAMPVGRRLAFDPERGRLWVVCPRCGEWNLTPLEERWEAIEACERRFAAASVRASSAHVGLAHTPGLDLLRLASAALRDELANWRYGTRLRRRQRRAALLFSAAGVAGGAAIGGALLAGAASSSLAVASWGVVFAGVWAVELVRGVGPVGGTSFIGRSGQRVRLAGSLVQDVRLGRTSGAKGPRALIAIAGAPGQEARYGRDAALRLLAAVLPRLNWRGADKDELRAATRMVDDEEGFAKNATGGGGNAEPAWQRIGMRHWPRDDLLRSMHPVARLAFEMAVTEELERRALAGEAAALEGRWRDAEEIAGIADAMFLPAFVTDWLARRGRGRRQGAGSLPGSSA
jgi:hypothetical protein